MRTSTQQEERELIGKMATFMRLRLIQNRHKSHWLDDSMEFLRQELRRELEELDDAIIKNEIGLIWAKAADVANFAAMIADLSTEEL